MTRPHFFVGATLGALLLVAAPASAELITVTLSGASENITDNDGVFGYGLNQHLIDKSFVEIFIVNTSAVNAFGPQTTTGVSSNSVFGGSPPYAVGATLTINGKNFSTIGSNYSSLFTTGDYQILSNDMVNRSVDNNFYVDLTGAGLPTTVNQPISLALAPGQAANVSFIDNAGGGNVSAAIGNLFPTQLAVSVAPAGPIPEPATWAMMMLGFALTGNMMRCRATKVALA